MSKQSTVPPLTTPDGQVNQQALFDAVGEIVETRISAVLSAVGEVVRSERDATRKALSELPTVALSSTPQTPVDFTPLLDVLNRIEVLLERLLESPARSKRSYRIVHDDGSVSTVEEG